MNADADDSQLSELQLTVVIPTLNESCSIADAIQSARAANIDDIIVVDGGSKDETVAIAERLGVTALSSKPGRGTQMNRGAAEAVNELILFLHADCRLPSDSLGCIRDAFARSEVVAAGFRQTISEPAFRYRLLEFGNGLRIRLLGWIYGDQALVVRKSAFQQAGLFRDIPLMEDLDISKRLKNVGKVLLLNTYLEVDARRWKRTGVIYQTLRNWSFVVLFHSGVSPEKLATWYRHVR